MYESSAHYHTDPYGFRYQIQIATYDGIVIFDSTPPLSFDLKATGVKIKRGRNWDYTVAYEIKDAQLYLCRLEARFLKSPPLFGVEPTNPYSSRVFTYFFENLPVNYNGLLTIGKDFDYKFWKHEDKARPVPFCKEVYKQNGFIQFENGRIIEQILKPRKTDSITKIL